MIRLIFMIVSSAFLVSCGSGSSNDRTGGGSFPEIEEVTEIPIGGYKLDIPTRYQKDRALGVAGRNKSNEIYQIRLMNKIVKGSYEIVGARSSIVTISATGCRDRLELLNRRAQNWSGELKLRTEPGPEMNLNTNLNYDSQAFGDRKMFLFEYVFERTSKGACLVVSAQVIKTVAQTFHARGGLGQLGAELQSILSSVRID